MPISKHVQLEWGALVQWKNTGEGGAQFDGYGVGSKYSERPRHLPYSYIDRDELRQREQYAANLLCSIPLTPDETLADLSRRIGAPYSAVVSLMRRFRPDFLFTLRVRRHQSNERRSKWGAVTRQLREQGFAKVSVPPHSPPKAFDRELRRMLRNSKLTVAWRWHFQRSAGVLTITRGEQIYADQYADDAK